MGKVEELLSHLYKEALHEGGCLSCMAATDLIKADLIKVQDRENDAAITAAGNTLDKWIALSWMQHNSALWRRLLLDRTDAAFLSLWQCSLLTFSVH